MSALQLILVGPGQRSYADPRHDVIDLGEVDDSQKAALLESAWALVQPSVNESFSRVIIEAWRAGTPVAVNARCEATADVVLEAGAGWTAATKAQWTALFHVLDRLGRPERDELGARGRRYVDEQTARERVLDRLENAVRAMRARPGRTRFDAAPEPLLTRRLNDGRRTILFAGPLGEKSCVDQLLAGFAFLLSLGIDARLTLLGRFDAEAGVADSFFEQVAAAGLGDRVLVFESANPQVAAACYRSADLFWSMAEDGPENEIVEALGYGIPIFVFKNERTAQTLGPAGLLFNDKRELRTLAGVAALVLTDGSLRETLLEGQRRRFEEIARPEALSLAG
jgi:glycosyltransferase involved in cell wall biosynthesis